MSLAEVQRRIDAALAAAGRPAGAARLVAVSKVQPLERIEAVLAAGHRRFGENRVQEAAGKWPAFRARFPGVELHLLGPLQTNKAKPAVEIFDAIQSLDRPALAEKLAALAESRGSCPNLYIQVNTGEEPQKAGVAPAEADAFVARCRALGLPVIGLMAIPPVEAPPEPQFRLLAEIAARNGLAELSMGMSADYETAIRCGATVVRVGSAIFGARQPA